MYGNRVFVATGGSAEGDRLYSEFVYKDTSGTLVAGMPVCRNLVDAGDQNTGGYIAATAVSPAQVNNGGQVTLAGNTNAGRLVGIFQPDNAGAKPNSGDAIKCLFFGIGVGRVDGGGGAVLVGSILICVIAGGTSNFLRLGAAALRTLAGEALPTGSVVALAAQIIANAGAATNVNMHVQIN